MWNASERRTTISGLMPARALMMADSVLRLTPSACAAAVTVSPSGSNHSVIQHRQDLAEAFGMLGLNAGLAPGEKEAGQPLVSERSESPRQNSRKAK
jgi:hypothetical protein